MLALLLSLQLSFTHAQSPSTPEDCGNVDLRNDYLGPARDQGEVAWCYAFSSTDLLAYRFRETERLSAADVAIGHNNAALPSVIKRIQDLFKKNKDPESFNMPYQTGFSKIALTRALNTGTCPESIFPSENWIKTTANGKSESVKLKTAMLDIAELKKQIGQGLSLDQIPYWYALEGVDKAAFYDIVKRTHRLDIFARLRRMACESHRREYANVPHVTMKIKSKNIFNFIDRELSQENPVLLDYDSRLLKDAKHSGVSINHLHTSLLVGRRWINDRCEYLIRDSYGTGCNRYDSSYQCEAGHVWIPQSYIHRSMTSVVVLDRL